MPPTLATLGTRMADLARSAHRLNDEIEVTNLQRTYGYYLDRKLWDDVADLFATDGTMEMGLQGVYAGRTSIRRGLPTPGGFGEAGQALWSQSIYENEFVKQGGVWKFKAMHVYPRFIVDAEKGWAKDAQPTPGPSREFPPDRQPPRRTRCIPAFTSRRSTSITP